MGEGRRCYTAYNTSRTSPSFLRWPQLTRLDRQIHFFDQPQLKETAHAVAAHVIAIVSVRPATEQFLPADHVLALGHAARGRLGTAVC